MPSTFFGLYISTSGILAAQAGLQTTAHNTANENTKGYTRQVATMQASSPARAYARYGMIGSGVDVISIDQMRDSYYDVMKRNSMNLQQNGIIHYRLKTILMKLIRTVLLQSIKIYLQH